MAPLGVLPQHRHWKGLSIERGKVVVVVVVVAVPSGRALQIAPKGVWPPREGVGAATEKAKHQTLARDWDEERERERVRITVIINQTKRSFKSGVLWEVRFPKVKWVREGD